MTLQITGISGSLRSESNNSKLIDIAADCCPDGMQFTVADCLGELPHFNPDLNVDDFDVLRQWVDLVRQSDGLVISSPEYARGYPGTLKNALDWLVQTDAHIEKPFMLLNASDRSQVARKSLIVVLETMSGIHIEDASLTIPLLGKALSLEQLKADETVADRIHQALLRFSDGILKVG